MKKRFLVLVDFKESSSQILHFAREMAGTKAQLVIIHQSNTIFPVMGDSVVSEKAKEEDKKLQLGRLKKFVKSELGSTSGIKFCVTTGDITELILDMSNTKTVDILFTGIYEKDLIMRLLTGNTAVKLADHTNGIIFAIPQNTKRISAEVLCVAVTEKYALNTKALDDFIAVTDGVRKLRFFTAVKSVEKTSAPHQHLNNIREGYNAFADADVDVVEGERLEKILEYVKNNKGLLVVQKGSRNFSDLLRPFFTSQIIQSNEVPVVILPQPDVV